MRGLRTLVRGVVGMSPAEWREVARAQVALLRAELRVRTTPADALVAPTASLDGVAVALSPASRDDAVGIARAIRRAAEHGVFRPKCLARSVALRDMLERRGIRGVRVHVGVRMEDGRFEAHAWVELGGRVLGDKATHTTSFTRLADVRPLEG